MVIIILGNGFEETEAIAPYDILKRGGVDVRFAGIGGREVTGGHGMTVISHMTVEEIDPENIEMIVVPGGLGGVSSILGSSTAMNAVKRVYDAGRKTAAICAGPRVLSELGILDGKNAVCYPGMENEMKGAHMSQEKAAVTDGNVSTGRGAGAALSFGFELLRVLKGEATAEKVAGDIYFSE